MWQAAHGGYSTQAVEDSERRNIANIMKHSRHTVTHSNWRTQTRYGMLVATNTAILASTNVQYEI